ncbi:hypothetical protein RRG08_064870 [Elysia crispata]|uniref:Uncharacterized protein n=1 Tax=Elysia crispata TaxID=231223 RepID=A0AAE0XMD2_9GAST|nr:hypothetical protein RRG08_064870 [Elysia crispata]
MENGENPTVRSAKALMSAHSAAWRRTLTCLLQTAQLGPELVAPFLAERHEWTTTKIMVILQTTSAHHASSCEFGQSDLPLNFIFSNVFNGNQTSQPRDWSLVPGYSQSWASSRWESYLPGPSSPDLVLETILALLNNTMMVNR